MKTKLLAMMILAGGSMFAQPRLSVGIGFGEAGAGFYQPVPSYEANIPPCPGPDYVWVDGYWSQDRGRRIWIAGNWNRRPFNGGYQAVPRFDNRFNDRDHREVPARGVEPDRRGNDHGRAINPQDRNQARGFRGR